MKGLFGDFVFYGFTKALGKSISLITFPIIASRLAVEEYGWFDYNMYLFSVVGTLFLMGLDSGLVRSGNDERFTSYQSELITTPFFIFIAVMFFVAFLCISILLSERFVFHQLYSIKDSAIIFMGALGYTFTMYSLTILRLKFLKLKYSVIGTFLPFSILMSLGLLISTGMFSLQNILIVVCLLYFVNGVIGVYAINMYLNKCILPKNNVKILISYSVPMGIIVLSGLLLPLLERSYLLGNGLTTDLGLYSAGHKISLIFGMPIIIFQTAFYPRFFKNVKKNLESNVLDAVMKVLVVLFAIFAVMLDLTSEIMIKILAGDGYIQAAIVVSYLIIGQYLVFVGTFCGIGTIITDKSYFRLVIYVISTLVFYVLMLTYSDKNTLIKVLTAGLVSRVFFFFCEIILSRKLMPIKWTYNLIAIAIVWVFMMVFWVDVRSVGWWGFCFSVILFIVVAGLFIDRSDLKIMKKVFTFDK